MSTKSESIIRDNYEKLLDRISTISIKHGRNFNDVTPVLVTKRQPAAKINAVIDCGARHLAENYPELLISKLPDIRQENNITWHMIGHIQSRKANLVVDHFQYIHSIDSIKIAKRISDRATEKSIAIPVLIEINNSSEISKGGFSMGTQAEYDRLLEDLAIISSLPNLQIRGLMTMPPYSEFPENSREYFIRLRELLNKINQDFPDLHLTELSMGTSQDYEVAIEEGATFIRIGTAVFGEREEKI